MKAKYAWYIVLAALAAAIYLTCCAAEIPGFVINHYLGLSIVYLIMAAVPVVWFIAISSGMRWDGIQKKQKPLDWFWCLTCNHPAVICPKCKNSSCNGSGCDACFETFKLANQMVADGTAPLKGSMPEKEDGLTKLLKHLRKKDA